MQARSLASGWRFTQLGLAALIFGAIAWSPGAQATTHRDAQAMATLYQRSLDLTQALTDAVGGGVSQLNATGDAQSLDCLETLREAASEVSDRLMDVRDVAALSSRLHRLADRRLGSAAASAAAARALEVLPAESRQVNQTAGLCLTQAQVQQRARDELLLINDATSALERLQGGSARVQTRGRAP
jgi:hypothetical protein